MVKTSDYLYLNNENTRARCRTKIQDQKITLILDETYYLPYYVYIYTHIYTYICVYKHSVYFAFDHKAALFYYAALNAVALHDTQLHSSINICSMRYT